MAWNYQPEDEKPIEYEQPRPNEKIEPIKNGLYQ